MVDIGIRQPIILSLPSLTSQAAQSSQIGLSHNQASAAPAAPTALPPDGIPDQVSYSAQAAEQVKAAEAQAVSHQPIANPYVVSDQEFSIYKGTDGQYVTRIYNLKDGTVTYIPKPALATLGNSSSSNSEPLVQIKV